MANGYVRKDKATSAAGYSIHGFVINPDRIVETMTASLAKLGDRIFNVHPFLPSIGGYGIRWELSAWDLRELSEYEREELGL